MSFTKPQKVDLRLIPFAPGEIRAFVTVRNEVNRLPSFLKHHRRLGVDRFFFVDNMSTDGSDSYLLKQSDCHVYQTSGNHFAENVNPLNWTNSLCNLFGDGHWCLTVDADELFIYPHYETLALREFCNYLASKEFEAVAAPMVDMYSSKPILQTHHHPNKDFLDTCPLFDPQPDWVMPVPQTPGWQMFGGVRRRVFWQGLPENNIPPCISKVPLIKWRRGMEYLSSTHVHSGASVAPFRGAILHFKFIDGFVMSSQEQLDSSKNFYEKGLGERAVYVQRLSREPDLCLANNNSLAFKNSAQLVKTGWMTTSQSYEYFVRSRNKLQKKTSYNKGLPKPQLQKRNKNQL